jgi:hypothetical protein
MEYDRNQNSYSSTSPAGDYYRYRLPDLTHPAGRVVSMADENWLGTIDSVSGNENKAEVDCLLCHLHDNSGISGNGLAFLQSMGCSISNPIGPINDPTCSTVPANTDGSYSVYGLTGAGWNPGWTGAKYDMYNRALAIKARQFDLAASLGIGAIANLSPRADGTLAITGISGMPATISASNIQATPNSQNCAVCHARDDSTAGLDGMYKMRFGYGGYELITVSGTGYDSETGGTNSERWLELGCKTGMGKRAHRIGAGPNDKWNNSMIRTMYGLDAAYPNGTAVATGTINITTGPFSGETVTQQARIPDQDVHDAGGMQCATCHYTLGSTSLEGGSKTIPATTYTDVLPLSEGTIIFPQKTYNGIDHQFAKFGTMEDTNAMPNINGTVSCESCHTTKTHPRYWNPDGTAKAVTPFPPDPASAHAGFPAIHFQKISCTTCHIPEIYAAPGRLKYRDFSLGYYKKSSDASGGWRNMLDWNWDFIHWSAKPVPPIHVWATRNGQTQIVPVLPSTIPAWEESNTNTATESNSDAAVAGKTGTCNMTATRAKVGQACGSDADCGGVSGSCDNPALSGLNNNQFFVANPGKGMTPGPVKARDTSTAALAVENSPSSPLRRSTVGACSNDGAGCLSNSDCTGGGTCTIRKNELNGANLVPLFDGFPLSDSWGADTKPRIDAMYNAGAGPEMRIYQAARFDVTHGVVPKEWALGGPNRGGCVSCHSSADQWQRDDNGNYVKDADGNPLSNPNYNANSVAFFEGYQQPFMGPSPMFNNFFGVTQYDLIKNWFALFADSDGTAMTNGLHMTQGFCYNMCVNRMNMPYASCAQFCPGAGAVGSPTSNTPYAALYFCDDGAGGMPDPSTCGTGGHFAPSSHMGDTLVGYMPMGLTDTQYYDPVSGMPKSTGVVGLQYECASYTMTGGDCSTPSATAECAMSGASGDTCTSTSNPNYNRPISPNGRIYANFMTPCWDYPVCSMPNPNYQTEAYDPFLAAVTGFMLEGFDTLMYYAPGTSESLGWYDGISAMTRLIVRETQSGFTDGCDPYAGGAASMIGKSPNFFGASLNNCVPNSATFNGVCDATMGMCMGGVMSYQPCTTNADCQGALSGADLTQLNGQGYPSLLYSRAEIRDRFKINLQQTCGGSYNPDGTVNNACTGAEANPLVPGGITYANARLTWPIGSERNPDNPAHIPAWDEAGKLNVCGKYQNQPCCTDMMGNPVTCRDGAYVKTTIHMNQFLGFTPTYYAQVTSPALVGSGSGSQTSLNCLACHTSVTLNHPTGYGTPGLPTDSATCRTCHLASGMQVHVGTNWMAPAIVDNVCGQCHGGNTTTTHNGAPYITTAALLPVALNIHGGGAPAGTTPPAVSSIVTAGAGGFATGVMITLTDASTDAATAQASLLITVDWGDGAVSTGFGGGTFTHTYTNAGTFSIVETVTNAGGLSASKYTPEAISATAPTTSITGTVYNSFDNSVPAADVKVKLKNAAGAVKQVATTDNNGNYTFTGLPTTTTQDYTIVARNVGTQFSYTPAIVPSGTTLPATENLNLATATIRVSGGTSYSYAKVQITNGSKTMTKWTSTIVPVGTNTDYFSNFKNLSATTPWTITATRLVSGATTVQTCTVSPNTVDLTAATLDLTGTTPTVGVSITNCQ